MKMTTKTLTAIAAATTLAACASTPDQIGASYVSPTPYAGMSCRALNAEAQRVTVRMEKATKAQQQAAGGDAAMMAVGLFLFAPAVLLLEGDKTSASELASLKGQAETIGATAAQKGC